jgi:autotransporter-associated beta strand protein
MLPERPRLPSLGGAGGMRRLARTALLGCGALVAAALPAVAQDATWLLNPGSGDFDTAANWTPATVPTGTAFFAASNTTTLSFSAATALGGWTFNAGAPSYTFNNTQSVSFTGAGIVINAGSATINNNFPGDLFFSNASTAGSATIISNGGVYFSNTSTAGSATITNNDGTVTFSNTSTAGSATISNNFFGSVNFNDSSTAGSATITVNNDFASNGGGALTFSDTSTAGSANISNTNYGRIFFIQNSSAGGATITNTYILSFNESSTAGSATITNNANALGGLDFNDSSTAGSATITNNSFMTFSNTSTAGSATITNNEILSFNDTSTAGSATIINNEGLTFDDGSTAGSATITNASTGELFFEGSTAGSANITNNKSLEFILGSTAGSAIITNNSGGTLKFLDTSTAGSATITNNSGGTITFNATSTAGSAAITNAASIEFFDTSTAGSAAITNNANINFFNTSTAGSATVINNHGAVLEFNDTSTAGSAIITNNGAGTINFNSSSTAGSATITNNALGEIDFIIASTAGTAAITNAGFVNFDNTSTAASATIINNGAGTIKFNNSSTADSAAITNAAIVEFFNTSTAGGATITNTAGSAVVDFSASTGPNGDGKLSAGSIAGGGNFYLGSDQLTVGGNNLSTTVSGVISDCGAGANCQNAGATGGSLVKVGTGTLTLTGIDTYTGATLVNGGTLEVDGTLTGTSSVTINSGGTLTGTGTVDPVTVTFGSGSTFTPGVAGTPGTSMTIAGNLAFQSGALYVVYVNPSSTTFANVTGTATLAGTVQANFAPGSYVGKHYTILQSAGLGGTTFSGVSIAGLAAGFDASLSYSADDVFLNLTASLGTGTPLNINEQNVATALNNYFNGGGVLPPAFLSIIGLSGSSLQNALTQLDGEDGTGAEHSAFQLMSEFMGLMLDPFVYGRGGPASGGGPLGFAPDQQASFPPDVALAYAGLLKAPPRQAFDQRWTVWGAGFGGSGTANGDLVIGSSNITTSTYGFAAGADYHVSPDTVLGFALAGSGTHWNLALAPGTGRSDAFQAGVYGTKYFGPAYMGAALAFTNNWFNTNRTALGDELTAKFQGQSYGARLEGGYRLAMAPTAGVTPYAAIQVQSFHTPSYSETDLTGGGFGLSYNAMSATDTRSELGGRFDALTAWGALPVQLRARIAWAHDWVNNPALSASFQALPGTSFVVYGAAVPHDSALTSVGAELHLTPRWTLLGKFDGEFAASSQLYAGSGTLRYTW